MHIFVHVPVSWYKKKTESFSNTSTQLISVVTTAWSVEQKQLWSELFETCNQLQLLHLIFPTFYFLNILEHHQNNQQHLLSNENVENLGQEGPAREICFQNPLLLPKGFVGDI